MTTIIDKFNAVKNKANTLIGVLDSFEDLYKILTIAHESGNMTALECYAGNWGENDTLLWISLPRPEYMMKCDEILPGIIDYDAWFTYHQDPYKHVKDTIQLVSGDERAVIDVKRFYSKFNADEIVKATDRDTVKKIKQSKRNHSVDLLVEFYKLEYMPKYTPTTLEVWESKKVSKLPQLTEGDNIAHSLTAFTERFNEFTCDLLKFPQTLNSKNHAFPWDKVVLAGGSLPKLVDPNCPLNKLRASDIDIFVYGDTVREVKQTVEILTAWFEGPNTWAAVNNSVTCLYFRDVKRKIQIISNAATKCAYDVIDQFDLDYVQWMYCKLDNNLPKLYCTTDALEALRSRCTRVIRPSGTTLKRIIKALYYGYDVVFLQTIVDNIVDVGAVINDKKQLSDITRKFSAYYYPISDPDMSDEEFDEYVTAMIECDFPSKAVGKGIQVMEDNFHLNGSFGDDYVRFNYKNFNIDDVLPRHTARVMTKNGFFKHSTDSVVITWMFSDRNLEKIQCRVDRQFIEFVTMLNARIPVKTGRRDDIEKIVIDGDVVTFEYDNWRSTGFINKCGFPLNPKEDLEIGDTVTIVFTIKIRDGMMRLGLLNLVKTASQEPPEQEEVNNEVNIVTAVEAPKLTYKRIVML